MQDVGAIVLEGLTARSLTGAPEVQDPPPMTPTQVAAYQAALRSMSYGRLMEEVDVMQQVYLQLEPALPSYRLTFDTYPHPIVQRRLLALNEVYRRAAADPVENYNHRRSMATLEWGAAGAIIGGILGYVTSDAPYLGASIGAVLGGVAGRSEILKTVLEGVSSRALMI